ncbi:DUF2017 family protein [Isoptericola sp. BMS4]|uniref:DUF2017 family protein n=1 Tax=Isoptericola sp. BMS4 TaxID=2527875 RepID=UPI00142205B8|nr:DUF2017 family protein [Isoptericola sp. BMS4]
MTPFRSAPAGYVARWEPVEREVLARVARDVAELVRADSGIGRDVEVGEGVAFTGVGRVPSDPAVRRLLPDAHRDDPDVADEFRHLTQTDLAAGKVARLEAFVACTAPGVAAEAGGEEGTPEEQADAAALEARVNDEVVVPREAAQDFAGALTDLRLVLAERLGLVDDEDVEDLHDAVLAGLDDDADELDEPDDGSRDDAGLTAGERRYWGGVFVAAGFAQETLVTEMLEDLRAGR